MKSASAEAVTKKGKSHGLKPAAKALMTAKPGDETKREGDSARLGECQLRERPVDRLSSGGQECAVDLRERTAAEEAGAGREW